MTVETSSLIGISALKKMSQMDNGSTGALWKTGVVYHESMAEPKCLWDDKYNERPERYTSVLQRYEIPKVNLLVGCN